MKVLVAMSGGIDSSVVAHLLQREGHELVGVRFTLWTDPLAPALAQILPTKCCNAQTAARCRIVAEELGIPLHILDLEEEFKKSVVDPFLEAHRHGQTPNPCIGCNKHIKFGRLIELAKKLECDRVATGHYARIERDLGTHGTERFKLLEAKDPQKDQSYYLYALSQEQLSRIMFPLGVMMKSDVYRLAEEFGVPFSYQSYRESQDLCFFPERTPKEFLRRHLHNELRQGDIVDRSGNKVGSHEGLPLYTIGQRKLGIGGLKIPLEVVEKDVPGNRLIVAEKNAERCSEVQLRDVVFLSYRPPEGKKFVCSCRLRSLSEKYDCTLLCNGTNGILRFSLPLAPPAPGQAAVLYRDCEIIGGGTIA